MSEHWNKALAELQEKLRTQESAANDTKRLINLVAAQAGMEPLYPDPASNGSSIFSIRSDQFHGRALATVLREFLNMRGSANLGAASLNDIYEALKRGGFTFRAKNEENAKRGLSVSLSKNQIFHRIPSSGAWGLSEWYPTVRPDKAGSGPSQQGSSKGGGDNDAKDGNGADD